MNRTKIVIADRFATEALVRLKDGLKKKPEIQIEYANETNLKEASALIIRSKFKVTSEVLNNMPLLKLVVTCTSGFDHIDLVETEKRNICVMYTPEANAISAAEHTWSLLCAANRQLTIAHQELKSGNWSRDTLMSQELYKKTLGIVGLGRIGSRVAVFARAFGMQVLAFDPYQEEEVFEKHLAKRVSYEELLKQSDIISFHVPNTFETRNMLSQSQIEYVSPELILINTSRGSVINEDDLAEALLNKKIKFAALDVFNKEPLGRESKLLKCKNILLTPHIGALTEEAFLKASCEAADLVIDFYEKQMTRNTLPLKNNWGSLAFPDQKKERN